MRTNQKAGDVLQAESERAVKLTERYTDPVLSSTEYHKLTLPYLSASMLRLIASEGPWVFYHTYVTGDIAKTESEACRLGTLFHFAQESGLSWESAVYKVPSKLEDDAVLSFVRGEFHDSKLTVSLDPGTEINMRSAAHRRYIEIHRQKANDSGKLWCTAEEAEQVGRQYDAVMDNPESRSIVERPCQRELPCFAKTDSALILKALLDIKSGGMGADFKTIRFNSQDAIVRECLSKGYAYQAAHYADVASLEEFRFICVTKTARPECLVFEPDHADLIKAYDANHRMYDSVAMCLDLNSWHSPAWGTVATLTRTKEII